MSTNSPPFHKIDSRGTLSQLTARPRKYGRGQRHAWSNEGLQVNSSMMQTIMPDQHVTKMVDHNAPLTTKQLNELPPEEQDQIHSGPHYKQMLYSRKVWKRLFKTPLQRPAFRQACRQSFQESFDTRFRKAFITLTEPDLDEFFTTQANLFFAFHKLRISKLASILDDPKSHTTAALQMYAFICNQGLCRQTCVHGHSIVYSLPGLKDFHNTSSNYAFREVWGSQYDTESPVLNTSIVYKEITTHCKRVTSYPVALCIFYLPYECDRCSTKEHDDTRELLDVEDEVMQMRFCVHARLLNHLNSDSARQNGRKQCALLKLSEADRASLFRRAIRRHISDTVTLHGASSRKIMRNYSALTDEDLKFMLWEDRHSEQIFKKQSTHVLVPKRPDTLRGLALDVPSSAIWNHIMHMVYRSADLNLDHFPCDWFAKVIESVEGKNRSSQWSDVPYLIGPKQGITTLDAQTIETLLVRGGVEKNPGPGASRAYVGDDTEDRRKIEECLYEECQLQQQHVTNAGTPIDIKQLFNLNTIIEGVSKQYIAIRLDKHKRYINVARAKALIDRHDATHLMSYIKYVILKTKNKIFLFDDATNQCQIPQPYLHPYYFHHDLNTVQQGPHITTINSFKQIFDSEKNVADIDKHFIVSIKGIRPFYISLEFFRCLFDEPLKVSPTFREFCTALKYSLFEENFQYLEKLMPSKRMTLRQKVRNLHSLFEQRETDQIDSTGTGKGSTEEDDVEIGEPGIFPNETNKDNDEQNTSSRSSTQRNKKKRPQKGGNKEFIPYERELTPEELHQMNSGQKTQDPAYLYNAPKGSEQPNTTFGMPLTNQSQGAKDKKSRKGWSHTADQNEEAGLHQNVNVHSDQKTCEDDDQGEVATLQNVHNYNYHPKLISDAQQAFMLPEEPIKAFAALINAPRSEHHVILPPKIAQGRDESVVSDEKIYLVDQMLDLSEVTPVQKHHIEYFADQNKLYSKNPQLLSHTGSDCLSKENLDQFLKISADGRDITYPASEDCGAAHRDFHQKLSPKLKKNTHGRTVKNVDNHQDTAQARRLEINQMQTTYANGDSKVLYIMIGGSLSREACYHKNFVAQIVINPCYDTSSRAEWECEEAATAALTLYVKGKLSQLSQPNVKKVVKFAKQFKFDKIVAVAVNSAYYLKPKDFLGLTILREKLTPTKPIIFHVIGHQYDCRNVHSLTTTYQNSIINRGCWFTTHDQTGYDSEKYVGPSDWYGGNSRTPDAYSTLAGFKSVCVKNVTQDTTGTLSHVIFHFIGYTPDEESDPLNQAVCLDEDNEEGYDVGEFQGGELAYVDESYTVWDRRFKTVPDEVLDKANLWDNVLHAKAWKTTAFTSASHAGKKESTCKAGVPPCDTVYKGCIMDHRQANMFMNAPRVAGKMPFSSHSEFVARELPSIVAQEKDTFLQAISDDIFHIEYCIHKKSTDWCFKVFNLFTSGFSNHPMKKNFMNICQLRVDNDDPALQAKKFIINYGYHMLDKAMNKFYMMMHYAHMSIMFLPNYKVTDRYLTFVTELTKAVLSGKMREFTTPFTVFEHTQGSFKFWFTNVLAYSNVKLEYKHEEEVPDEEVQVRVLKTLATQADRNFLQEQNYYIFESLKSILALATWQGLIKGTVAKLRCAFAQWNKAYPLAFSCVIPNLDPVVTRHYARLARAIMSQTDFDTTALENYQDAEMQNNLHDAVFSTKLQYQQRNFEGKKSSDDSKKTHQTKRKQTHTGRSETQDNKVTHKKDKHKRLSIDDDQAHDAASKLCTANVESVIDCGNVSMPMPHIGLKIMGNRDTQVVRCVTTNFQDAIAFVNLHMKDTIYADFEADPDTNIRNALTLIPKSCDRVLLWHAFSQDELNIVIQLLKNTEIVHFQGTLEHVFEKRRDIGGQLFSAFGYKGTFSLNDYAHALGRTGKIGKPDFKCYSKMALTREQEDYAIQDVALIKELDRCMYTEPAHSNRHDTRIYIASSTVLNVNLEELQKNFPQLANKVKNGLLAIECPNRNTAVIKTSKAIDVMRSREGGNMNVVDRGATENQRRCVSVCITRALAKKFGVVIPQQMTAVFIHEFLKQHTPRFYQKYLHEIDNGFTPTQVDTISEEFVVRAFTTQSFNAQSIQNKLNTSRARYTRQEIIPLFVHDCHAFSIEAVQTCTMLDDCKCANHQFIFKNSFQAFGSRVESTIIQRKKQVTNLNALRVYQRCVRGNDETIDQLIDIENRVNKTFEDVGKRLSEMHLNSEGKAELQTTCVSSDCKYQISSDLVITKYEPRPCKNRRIKPVGPVPNPEHQPLDVSCQCAHCALHAILTRAVYTPVIQNPKELKEFDAFLDVLAKHLTSDVHNMALDVDIINTARAYIDRSSHTTPVKELHHANLDKLLERLSQTNQAQIFTKTEVLASNPRAGRVIQSRTTCFRDLADQAVNYVQEQLIKRGAWVKGLTPEDIQELAYTRFYQKDVKMSDYTCFDQSQADVLLKAEIYVMRYMFGKEWTDFYESIIRSPVVMRINREVELVAQPQRSSGDRCTSTANTLVNMALILYACWKSQRSHQSAEQFLDDFNFEDMLVEGDDSMFKYDIFINVFENTLTGLGVKTVCDTTKNKELEFLKVTFMTVGGEVYPVKNPINQLARAFCNPKHDYSFHSQRCQMLVQASLASMIMQYGYPQKLYDLLQAVQVKSGRSYFRLSDLQPLHKFDEKWLNKHDLTFDANNRVVKRYAAFSVRNLRNQGEFFDMEFGKLVDNIIHALMVDLPFYDVPVENMVWTTSKGKILHQPKISQITHSLNPAGLIRGRMGLSRPISENEELSTPPENVQTVQASTTKMVQNTESKLQKSHLTRNNHFNPVPTAPSPRTYIQSEAFMEKKFKEAMDALLTAVGTGSQQNAINAANTILPGVVQQVFVDSIRDKDGELKDLESGKYSAPAIVFASGLEYDILKARLKDVAERGYLLAISKNMFEAYRGADITQARAYVSEMTKHNDKMGYDWYKPSGTFVRSHSEQFAESQYKNFLKAAATYCQAAFPKHAQYLDSIASNRFQTSRAELLAKSDRVIEMPSRSQNFSRTIRGKKTAQNRNGVQYNLYQHEPDGEILPYGTQRRLEELEQTNESLALELESQRIRGDKQVQMKLEQIPQFGAEITRMMQNLKEKVEGFDRTYPIYVNHPWINYPVHPRVPEMAPEPTKTIRLHDELTISFDQTNTECFIFGNHGCTQTPAMIARGNPTNPVMNGLRSGLLLTSHTSQLGEYTATVAEYSGAQLKAVFSKVQSRNLATDSLDVRLVAGGTKLIKISRSENESGYAIATSGPKGISLHQQKWQDHFEKPDVNRKKVYLADPAAQHSIGMLGAVYRPHDVQDVTGFFSPNTAVYQNRDQSAFSDSQYTSPVYFTGGDNHVELENLVDNNQYRIVFNTDLRHSYAFYLNSNSSPQFELNVIRHFEYLPTTTEKDSETGIAVIPIQYSNAVQMLRYVTETDIYGTYNDLFMEMLKQELVQMPVVGIWSNTIVPAFEDFKRWGKEVISSEGIADFLTSSAGDIAIAALGFFQPEIAAAIKLGVDALELREPKKTSQFSQMIRGPGRVRLEHIQLEAFRKHVNATELENALKYDDQEEQIESTGKQEIQSKQMMLHQARSINQFFDR